MTTPAENAATVREAFHMCSEEVPWADAALDALLAQAETAAKDCEEAERLYDQAEQIVTRMERERDQAREALRRFVGQVTYFTDGDGSMAGLWDAGEEARAVLATLTGEGTGYGPDAGIEFPDDGGES